jgi:hypothetical protein
MVVTKQDIKNAEKYWKNRIEVFDKNHKSLKMKVNTPTDIFKLKDIYLKLMNEGEQE